MISDIQRPYYYLVVISGTAHCCSLASPSASLQRDRGWPWKDEPYANAGPTGDIRPTKTRRFNLAVPVALRRVKDLIQQIPI